MSIFRTPEEEFKRGFAATTAFLHSNPTKGAKDGWFCGMKTNEAFSDSDWERAYNLGARKAWDEFHQETKP